MYITILHIYYNRYSTHILILHKYVLHTYSIVHTLHILIRTQTYILDTLYSYSDIRTKRDNSTICTCVCACEI